MFLLKNKSYISIFFLGLIIRLFGLTNLGFKYDTVTVFYTWAELVKKVGLFNYWSNPSFFTYDYPPLGILLYYLLGIPCINAQCFVVNFKIFNNFVDLLLSVIVAYFLPGAGKIRSRLAFALIWLNPSIIFISSFWGQYDSLIVLLVYVSMIALCYKKPILSGSFFALNLCIKPVYLIFLPAILVFSAIYKKFKLFSLSTLLFFIFINGAFFIIKPGNLITVYLAQFHRASMPTNGAANFWSLFYFWNIDSVTNIYKISIAPDYLGIFLFLSFFLVFTVIFFKLNYLRSLNFNKMAEIFTINNLLIFLFLTKMHSRYGHFALVGSLVSCLLIQKHKKKYWWLYCIFTIIFNISYFINQLYVYFTWYPINFLSFNYSNVLTILSIFNIFCLLLVVVYYLSQLTYLKKSH